MGQYSITHYEMYNITVALKVWARRWQNRVVCIFCDNLGAVTVAQTGKTRDVFLNACLHALWLTAARFNIQLRVMHIPGKDNVLADALSREKVPAPGEYIWEHVTDSDLDLFCRGPIGIERPGATGIEQSRIGTATAH